MSDFNTVAKSFVEFYYQTFDTNRPGLLPLYVSLPFVCGCSLFLIMFLLPLCSVSHPC